MEFDVVISFAGENREIAEIINNGLKHNGVNTFYDEDHKAFLWGKFLAEELSDIYTTQGKYCLMIISEFYIKKVWPRHERRAAISRLIREEREYVLPYIVDDTKIENISGFNRDIHYLHVKTTSPVQIVNLILEKLGLTAPTAQHFVYETCGKIIIKQIYRRIHSKTDNLFSEPYRTKLLSDFFAFLNIGRDNSHERRKLGIIFRDVLSELKKRELIYVVYSGELGDLYDLTKHGYDLWEKLQENDIVIFPNLEINNLGPNNGVERT